MAARFKDFQQMVISASKPEIGIYSSSGIQSFPKCAINLMQSLRSGLAGHFCLRFRFVQHNGLVQEHQLGAYEGDWLSNIEDSFLYKRVFVENAILNFQIMLLTK